MDVLSHSILEIIMLSGSNYAGMRALLCYNFAFFCHSVLVPVDLQRFYTPQVLYCACNSCIIPRDAVCYVYKGKEAMVHYCKKCFSEVNKSVNVGSEGYVFVLLFLTLC